LKSGLSMNTSKEKLVVVGLGIKLISHTTHEAKLAIQDADEVLYISPTPLFDEYIKKLNAKSRSLNYFYEKTSDRQKTYELMSEEIVGLVRGSKKRVCVVFYGHPCVFSKPGLLAVSKLKESGLESIILPGISAEACIYADLQINPSIGTTNFEATDLVLRQRQIDTSALLILWQPYMFGCASSKYVNENGTDRFHLLKDYLLRRYPEDHMVIGYSAGMYPGTGFLKCEVRLDRLHRDDLSIESTLIIPPCRENTIDTKMQRTIFL
jgi:tetrapyrrole methylase family protein / MazG family protein